MVLAMHLLLTIALMQTVGCDENRSGGRENRETGRNVRHLNKHVEELEGVVGDGDLVVSRPYRGPTDEEATKEQAKIVLHRIRDTFLSIRDRQSPDAKRKEEDEIGKDAVQKSSRHESPPTDQKGRKGPPVLNLTEAIERRTIQKREQPHIMNHVMRRRREGLRRRRELRAKKRRRRSIDSTSVNKILLQCAQSATKAGFEQHKDNTCFFERPAGAENYHVTSAAIHVYIQGCKGSLFQPNTIHVYRILPQMGYQVVKEEEEDKELISTKIINGSDVSAWYRFDVTTMVRSWMRAGSLDKDWVALTVEFKDFDQQVVCPLEDSGDQEHLPYLELNVEPKTISRRRRSISTSESEMENSDYSTNGVNPPATAEEECDDATRHCCRRSMNVDFEAVGMRWIISPRSFHVSYCNGQCSTMSTEVRLMSPGLAAAIADRRETGLCCVPVEYTDQDVVYYDEKMQVVSGTLRNFNVIRCGCL